MEDFTKTLAIDWGWVEKHLSARERLEKIGEGEKRESVIKCLKEALAIAKSKAAPAAVLVKEKIVKSGPASLDLEDGISLAGKELARHVKGATHIYAFLVTIGKEIEEAASSYMNSGDHLLGYLLDRVGSFAAESLAKNMEDGLRMELLAEGMSVSMRFSPGYCDWPIEEQFKLAKLIDFSKAGVVLTENCMMIPKKSISAVAAIGTKGLFTKVTSPCAVCNMKICDYRRKE